MSSLTEEELKKKNINLKKENEKLAEEILIFKLFLENPSNIIQQRDLDELKKGRRINIIGYQKRNFVVKKQLELLTKEKEAFMEKSRVKNLKVLSKTEELNIEEKENKKEKIKLISAVQRLTNGEQLLSYVNSGSKRKEREIKKYKLLCAKLRGKEKAIKSTFGKTNTSPDKIVKRIHVDCLLIENGKIKNKIMKTNEALKESKKKNVRISILLRKKNAIVNEYLKNFEKIQRKIQTRKRILNQSKKAIISVTHDLKNFKTGQKTFFEKLNSLNTLPSVESYIQLKKELREEKKEEDNWERKNNIQKTGKIVYGSFLKKLNKVDSLLSSGEYC